MDKKITPLWLKQPQPIPFDVFMGQALYEPTHGYYQQQQTPLGRDFQTAPMISQGLGFALAHSIASCFSSPYVIHELGPGQGHLMASVLRTLQEIGHLPKEVYLYDISTARLKDSLAHISSQFSLPIHAHQHPPENWTGALIANECLDAMPFKRYYWDGENNHECLVSVDCPTLSWKYIHAPHPLTCRLPADYFYERCAYDSLRPWLASCRGMMWLIDYGYDQNILYHPERQQGTMSCFYRGQYNNDPLQHPGNQDITAHVNWSSIAHLTQLHGLDIYGYTTQGMFMQECLQAAKNYPHDPQSLKTLMQPQHMGETIKVMVCGSDMTPALGTGHKTPLTLDAFCS